MKTDLVWPTLTDDKRDNKDVVLFYEELEDICALANNCRGMSTRERLLALRARCKGSRKSGEVISDPEAVYLRIKNKRLMFGSLQEIRQDKRIWPGDGKDVGLRSLATWEESHKVVLEYEQREAAHSCGRQNLLKAKPKAKPKAAAISCSTYPRLAAAGAGPGHWPR